jgi:hypothetical protein
MKKIYATKLNTPVVPQHRLFRRFVKKMFASFLKRQPDASQNDFQSEVIQRLKGLEEMIESVARKPGRRTRRGQ